jgi:hypothetical protein
VIYNLSLLSITLIPSRLKLSEIQAINYQNRIYYGCYWENAGFLRVHIILRSGPRKEEGNLIRQGNGAV